MLIILEGPDGAGKTTLANALHEQLERLFPDDTVHRYSAGPPTHQNGIDEYVVPLTWYHPDQGHHVICDRWHIGERVYPSVFMRPYVVDNTQNNCIDHFLWSRDALIVQLTASVDTLTKRLDARGDDRVTPVMIPRIREKFAAEMMASLTYPTNYVVTDRQSRRDVFETARMIIHAAASQHRPYETAHVTTYVGPRYPNTILVGDKRGTTDELPPATDLRPAFLAYPERSGYFLWDAVSLAPKELRRSTAFVNVNDVDDLDDVLDIVYRHTGLLPPRLVALGNRAAEGVRRTHTYTRRDVRDMAVQAHHPQYVRRFRHYDHDSYLDELYGTPLC